MTIKLRAIDVIGNSAPRPVKPYEARHVAFTFPQQMDLHYGEDFEIDLTGKTWTVETLNMAFSLDFINRVRPSLVVLKISGTTSSLKMEQGYAVLKWYNDNFQGCPKLTEVYLDSVALGTKGMDFLGGVVRPESDDQPVLYGPCLLSTPSIRVLSLYNCSLTPADTSTLYKQLVKEDGKCHLTTLGVGKNNFGTVGSVPIHLEDLLAACTDLKCFQFSGKTQGIQGDTVAPGSCHGKPGSDITVSHARGSLVRGLQRILDDHDYIPLRRIELAGALGEGSKDEHTLEDLCMVLARAPYLNHLCLQEAGLGVSGLKHVLDALRKSRVKLQHFDIKANDIGVEGAEELANFLGQGEGAELRYIDLEECYIEDEGLETLVAGLEGCSQFRGLSLGSNSIEKEESLLRMIAALPNLEFLSLEKTFVTAGVIQALASLDGLVELNLQEANIVNGEADPEINKKIVSDFARALIGQRLPALKMLNLMAVELPERAGIRLTTMYKKVWVDNNLVDDGKDY